MTKRDREYQRKKLSALIIEHPEAEVIVMAERSEEDSVQAYSLQTIQHVEYTHYAFYRDTLFVDENDLAEDIEFYEDGDDDHISSFLPDAKEMMREKAIIVWLNEE